MQAARRLLSTQKGLVSKYLKHDECYDLVYDGDGDDQWWSSPWLIVMVIYYFVYSLYISRKWFDKEVLCKIIWLLGFGVLVNWTTLPATNVRP